MHSNGQASAQVHKGSKAQPFSEHIRELRTRMMVSIIALIVGTAVGYIFHEQLFNIIRAPLHAKLYYTTPTGGFNAILKISILFGVVVAIPIFIYQMGKFLTPAFRYRLRARRILIPSIALAALGISFAYYVSLPASLHFLANIDSSNFQSLITINDYLNFVFGYIAGFALLFQLPMILLFINRIKPQKPGNLMRMQRWVILFSFILAAVLTPTPDPMNQCIMALPIILLYQFSVMLIWFVNLRNRRKGSSNKVEDSANEEFDILSFQPILPKPSTIIEPTSYQQPDEPVSPQTSKPILITDVFSAS